jgi:hypothetical protein
MINLLMNSLKLPGSKHTWFILLLLLGPSLGYAGKKGGDDSEKESKASKGEAEEADDSGTPNTSIVLDLTKPVENSTPLPPGNPHAYFDTISKRSEVVASHSLRTAEQLKKYSKPKPAQHVFYDPAGDKDPRKQDATRLVIPKGAVSMHNAFRLPIPEVKGKSIMVTWDAWFGREFMYDYSGLGKYKNFQFASGKIWTEVRARFELGYKFQKPPAVAMVDVRQYSQGDSWPAATETVKFNNIGYGGAVLGPFTNDFAIQPETWTRYFVMFNPTGKDNLFEFSLWLADVKRDPVLVLDKILIRPNPKVGRWNEFWFEYNSSSTNKNMPERIGYVRNWVALAGLQDMTDILQRPGAGSPSVANNQ